MLHDNARHKSENELEVVLLVGQLGDAVLIILASVATRNWTYTFALDTGVVLASDALYELQASPHPRHKEAT